MILESDKDVHLLVYVDASYGVHVDGKSHTGVTSTRSGTSRRISDPSCR